MYEDNNPQNLTDGEACFGLNLHILKNAYDGMCIQQTKPVPGTASHDPSLRSKNPADNPVTHFLPDDPGLFGDSSTSCHYSLNEWYITRTQSDAEKKRRQVLHELIDDRIRQMRTFAGLLDTDAILDIATCYPPTLMGLLAPKGGA